MSCKKNADCVSGTATHVSAAEKKSGNSGAGPVEQAAAAQAVAELIRSRGGTGTRAGAIAARSRFRHESKA